MKLMAKIALVLICISLCGTGAMMMSKAPRKNEPRKSKAIPVKNHELPQRAWSWA